MRWLDQSFIGSEGNDYMKNQFRLFFFLHAEKLSKITDDLFMQSCQIRVKNSKHHQILQAQGDERFTFNLTLISFFLCWSIVGDYFGECKVFLLPFLSYVKLEVSKSFRFVLEMLQQNFLNFVASSDLNKGT